MNVLTAIPPRSRRCICALFLKISLVKHFSDNRTKMKIFFFFFVFLVIDAEPTNWQNFFEKKCLKRPIPWYPGSACYKYTWDIRRCVPFRVTECDPQLRKSYFVKSNQKCTKLDCNNFLGSDEGKKFLAKYFPIESPVVIADNNNSTTTPSTTTPSTTTPATTTPSTTTPSTTTPSTTTQQPTTMALAMAVNDTFCDDNFVCQITTKFMSGCYRYAQSEDPDCHLFCQLESCR